MDSAYLIVMPLLRRGSLDKNLYVPDMHMSLQVRLNCLHGVAKGLHYLHVRPAGCVCCFVWHSGYSVPL
jgi:hypothetical protein